MKHLLNLTTLMLLCIVLAFTSCDKKDDPGPENSEIISGSRTFDASAYDKWVYFSFTGEKEVTVTDFSTSSNWDIGFHRYDVRINCGTSGPGQGGTFNAGKVDFASVSTAPETGYTVNDSIRIIESPAMPPAYVTVPGDTVLAIWLTFQIGQTGPEYTINDNIYVIKTADGKYAKIWLKDYFNNSSEAGYITMKYAYQPDGSRTLE